MKSALRIVPLGGLGHIGGNLMAYETPDDLVIVDCGVLFPGEEQPGVDYVIPDISYVLERQAKLRGIVLTHGHEDHIGALPYWLPELGVPVWGTDFTLALVAARLTEFPEVEADLRRLRERQPVQLGGLTLEALSVTHSIPGAVALALRTPVGVIVHTGDFKLDPAPPDGRLTDEAAFRALGDEGVAALLSDSTNAEKSGHTWGEVEVALALEELIAAAPFRVVATAFSSNIDRLQAIVRASERAGRQVVLAGRSITQNVQLALERGYLSADLGTLRGPEAFATLPRSRVTIIAAGSQGEPQSTLSRIAADEHGEIHLERGDRAILSARRIPGNERAIGAVVNNLCRLGVEVIDDRGARVHASGHAMEDELRAMLDWCRPRFFVPIHGEYRQLARHAALARDAGVPASSAIVLEDGQPLELVHLGDRVAAQRAEPVTAGLVYVESKRVGDVGEVVLRDRRVLAQTGLVVCVVIFDEGGGLVAGPSVITRGVMHDDESQQLLAAAEEEVRGALRALSPHSDRTTRTTEVRQALRRFFRRELERRPLIVPIVMTV